MKPQDHQLILREFFLKSAFVKDAKSGYIVAKPFNLCIDADILEIASRCWAHHYRKENIDAIVGLPDAGARLVSLLSNMLGIPTILPAKRSAIVPGGWEDVVSYENDSFTTGQKGVKSHIGFVQKGKRVLVIDDVVAHGDTAVAGLKALQDAGVEVVGMGVLFDKAWQGGLEHVEKETGIKVFSLIRLQTISPEGTITFL